MKKTIYGLMLETRDFQRKDERASARRIEKKEGEGYEAPQAGIASVDGSTARRIMESISMSGNIYGVDKGLV